MIIPLYHSWIKKYEKIIFMLLAALLMLIACDTEEPKEKTNEGKQDQSRQDTINKISEEIESM